MLDMGWTFSKLEIRKQNHQKVVLIILLRLSALDRIISNIGHKTVINVNVDKYINTHAHIPVS